MARIAQVELILDWVTGLLPLDYGDELDGRPPGYIEIRSTSSHAAREPSRDFDVESTNLSHATVCQTICRQHVGHSQFSESEVIDWNQSDVP